MSEISDDTIETKPTSHETRYAARMAWLRSREAPSGVPASLQEMAKELKRLLDEPLPWNRPARGEAARQVPKKERMTRTRSRSRVTQADVARSVRAAKQAGAGAIEVRPDGSILIHLTDAGGGGERLQKPLADQERSPF